MITSLKKSGILRRAIPRSIPQTDVTTSIFNNDLYLTKLTKRNSSPLLQLHFSHENHFVRIQKSKMPFPHRLDEFLAFKQKKKNYSARMWLPVQAKVWLEFLKSGEGRLGATNRNALTDLRLFAAQRCGFCTLCWSVWSSAEARWLKVLAVAGFWKVGCKIDGTDLRGSSIAIVTLNFRRAYLPDFWGEK